MDAFQRLIRDFGVAHHRDAATAKALNKLDAPFEFPPKAALVWGGGPDVRNARRNVLAPFCYTVHSVQQYQISAAHLAPYQIVVLARTGKLPYEPTDVLALRSYVATGGSLLVVVSPGWHNASPGIYNPVLTFFDAHAGQEMVVRANSARIVPHPSVCSNSTFRARQAIRSTAGSFPKHGTSNRGISSGLSSSFRTARCADWRSGDWPTANTVNYWMPDDRLRRVRP